ncbi:hypothetical protein HPB47_018640 [Ixodes persulcatus]|uniref:Uncharacterized protein n=1 Tax=Ixodes persulcatus TaxID=34615 RepID=A0AC60QKE1_IXOPE|nr:hypothetical protein HPB47_018640 [Ixodes persulcatus]
MRRPEKPSRARFGILKVYALGMASEIPMCAREGFSGRPFESLPSSTSVIDLLQNVQRHNGRDFWEPPIQITRFLVPPPRLRARPGSYRQQPLQPSATPTSAESYVVGGVPYRWQLGGAGQYAEPPCIWLKASLYPRAELRQGGGDAEDRESPRDTLKDEVLKIMPVQKQTRAGQRTCFKAFCSEEVATAILQAIILAKLSVIPVRSGYWGNKIGKRHTVWQRAGAADPAPRGTSIVSTPVPQKLLHMAGIEDCYTSARGSTATLGNFAKTTYLAIQLTWRERELINDAEMNELEEYLANNPATPDATHGPDSFVDGAAAEDPAPGLFPDHELVPPVPAPRSTAAAPSASTTTSDAEMGGGKTLGFGGVFGHLDDPKLEIRV